MLDENGLPLIIFVNKGIEINTRALTLEIIADTCGPVIARVATFIVSSSCDSVDPWLMSCCLLCSPDLHSRKKVWVYRVARNRTASLIDTCVSYQAATNLRLHRVNEQNGRPARVGLVPPALVPLVRTGVCLRSYSECL